MMTIDTAHDRQLIGARIKRLRDEQGLSLRRLASMIGMDHGYICDIERGKANATISAYAKIAVGLGVELRDLFDI